MQRYSEPSSPNPNDSDNFNDIAGNHETLSGWNNFPLNDISTEDDEGDVISTTSIPVGYALLGSETVHLAADDSGDDDDDDDSERNELSDTENDHLLNRHLNRTEFEPRGVFTNISLSTLDEADKIKMCMSNFHLPISRYPTWATQIPEELWKAKLLEKIEHNAKT
ncbi:hypothetical protein KSF78_0006785 [Schistosoma japonicum]|nr:hypothetical protein KSF78_0006785 [Schistosoma japonicum]